jgi:hypothetical protein
MEFNDKPLNADSFTSFIRTTKYQEEVIIDGILVLHKVKKQTSFIKTIRSHVFISSDFVTMDLETRVINNEKGETIMVPYAVSIYDGKDYQNFYLSDFSTSEEMLEKAVLHLMRDKYNNHKVYLHNFSFFDGIFMLKILSNLTTNPINPIIRDGRIIELKISFQRKGKESSNKKIHPFEEKNKKSNLCHLFFRDSYLLLPSSLRKLAINFGEDVDNKGIFPYKFVNNDINLDYNGKIPKYEYFDNISKEEYEEYCNDLLALRSKEEEFNTISNSESEIKENV